MEEETKVLNVYLEYAKAKPHFKSRDEYFATYDGSPHTYKMLKGAPLLVNVDGHYMYLSDILNLIKKDYVYNVIVEWSKVPNDPNFKWGFSFHLK